MTVIAVFNQKGGVGKTTTALNLAAALERSGCAVYGLDLDPQAHLSVISGISAASGDETLLSLFQRNRPLHELVKPSPNRLNIIPSHNELSKVDALFGKGYNIVNRLNLSLQAESFGKPGSPLIIDCSPIIGVLSLNAIFASSGVIVPISADHLSTKSAQHINKSLNALEQVVKRPIARRFLLTRFDSRRRMAWEVLRIVEESFGSNVCQTRISENVSLAESPALNKTVFEHAPSSRGAHDYDELLKELLADGFVR